jgi:hypothetical protein
MRSQSTLRPTCAEEERLEKVTFLRLFPQNNGFGFVDEIIQEIESKNRTTADEPPKEKIVTHCEVQTDEILDEIVEEEPISEIPQYPTQQINLIIPLCSATSFQYNDEAECASLFGRISNRFRNQELHSVNQQLQHISSHQLPTRSSVMEEESSKVLSNPKTLNESLETQQIRRLHEFVEWRRSLLQDGFT